MGRGWGENERESPFCVDEYGEGNRWVGTKEEEAENDETEL